MSDRVFKVRKNPLFKDTSKLAKLLESYRPVGADGEALDLEGMDSADAGGACDSDKND